MDKYSYSYSHNAPHGGSILVQEGVEQTQFIQAVFFGIKEVSPLQQVLYSALLEITPPHKRRGLPKPDDGTEAQLDILRAESLLSALCWALNDADIQKDPTITPYSFQVSTEFGSSSDKTWFELYRRVDGEHLHNFGRLIVPKDKAEMVKAALTKTCYILANNESALRNALKPRSAGPGESSPR